MRIICFFAGVDMVLFFFLLTPFLLFNGLEEGVCKEVYPLLLEGRDHEDGFDVLCVNGYSNSVSSNFNKSLEVHPKGIIGGALTYGVGGGKYVGGPFFFAVEEYVIKEDN